MSRVAPGRPSARLPAAIVTRKADPVQLELLLHEPALHRLIGGPTVMATQLRHLAEIGKRPNVSSRHPDPPVQCRTHSRASACPVFCSRSVAHPQPSTPSRPPPTSPPPPEPSRPHAERPPRK
ncbi:Scr1 family TA system antitoxin-like transcriptional regulator [Nocardia carnea]|uniref:Scr1 family TA system antitoxin-like transcriptional regulator n=1 Tax=Nocardia carnea TaxID=37328 RepID=UPI0024580CCB|nr:Scr1 family TA system antitoxin-like transcriptional regulator [Nocardia carnea]